MIGIYDSGLGGLTAFRELRMRRPDLDIVYYGDTAHLPYGNRPADALFRYGKKAVSFLMNEGADAVLVACGTVSSTVLPRLQELFPIPLFGVVEPTANLAYHISKNKQIGIIATETTVKTGTFSKVLKQRGAVKDFPLPCPLFVPLVENGWIDQNLPLPRLVCEETLKPLKGNIDTLILGCTHFSLLAHHIQKALPGVYLVGAGEAAAAALSATCPKVGRGESKFYVSEAPREFASRAKLFLNTPLSGGVHLAPHNESAPGHG